MGEKDQRIRRSFSMLIVAYYLSRCGQRVTEKRSAPPAKLGVKTWLEAYDLFFDALGDGRTRNQYHNSINGVRAAFNVLFENGQTGKIGAKGKKPSLSARLLRVHDEWKDRQDRDLEEIVFAIHENAPSGSVVPVMVRTEGGKRVYVSVRRVRDRSLVDVAKMIHVSDCMACGFNFEKFYGDIGKGFIEVHHLVPLSESGRTETNPETDLIVLCANCHRIVHKRKDICLSLDELKWHIGSQ